jgi:hypothetical protein
MNGHGWIRLFRSSISVTVDGKKFSWHGPLWRIPLVLCPVNEEAKGSGLLCRSTSMAVSRPGTPVLVNPQWGRAPSSCRIMCGCRCSFWGTAQTFFGTVYCDTIMWCTLQNCTAQSCSVSIFHNYQFNDVHLVVFSQLCKYTPSVPSDTWVSSLLMAKGHTRYWGLVCGPNVEESIMWYT